MDGKTANISSHNNLIHNLEHQSIKPSKGTNEATTKKMKFSSSNSIFAIMATLASFAKSARAQGCQPVVETLTVPFQSDFETLRFGFPNLPATAAPGTVVTVDGIFSGDINWSSEYADVKVGSRTLFVLGNKSTNLMQNAGSYDCWTDRGSLCG